LGSITPTRQKKKKSFQMQERQGLFLTGIKNCAIFVRKLRFLQIEGLPLPLALEIRLLQLTKKFEQKFE
jgi:hypothetical protein